MTGVGDEFLQAEHNVEVDATQSAGGFFVYAGNDYLTGTGAITGGALDITAAHDVNFFVGQYP